LECLITVFDWSREFRFERRAIPYGDNDAFHLSAHCPTDVIFRIQITSDPSASMAKEEQRKEPFTPIGARWMVDPKFHLWRDLLIT